MIVKHERKKFGMTKVIIAVLVWAGLVGTVVAESIPGCGCRTNGFSVVTGQSCISNSCGSVTASFVASSSTPSQFIPVGSDGAVNATKTTFNFRSTGGTATISELKFYVVNGQNTITSISVGGVTAPPVNGVVYLTGLNLPVPSGGGGLNVDAYVSYPPVSPNGLLSGAVAQFELEHITYSSGGVTYTTCATFEQGPCDYIMDVVVAPGMKLVGSKPTITLTPSISTLMPGLVEVAQVTVASDAKGDVTDNKIPFKVSLSAGLTISGDLVVKDQNNQVVITEQIVSTGGTITASFNPNGRLIVGGTSQTFKIYLEFGSVPANAVAIIGLATADLFSWTDTAGGSSVPVTTDNSTYFYGYPLNTVSLLGTGIRFTSITTTTNVQPSAAMGVVLKWFPAPGQPGFILERSSDFSNWINTLEIPPQSEGASVVFGNPYPEKLFWRIKLKSP